MLLFNTCLALSPENRLADETQEQRARELFLQVKCLTCNGQVIDSSDSDFAYKLRAFIRNEITNNKTDNEIKQQLIENFGQKILLTSNKKIYFILIFLPVIVACTFLIFFRKTYNIKSYLQ
jgi:cytochrome c-type biogenesis protein CcmH